MNDAQPIVDTLAISRPQDQSRPCVLAVDDDRVLPMTLEMIIEELGYRPLTASSGEEALTILDYERGTIDVVLIDREMPDMNGLEVVSMMREDRELSRIPVVMQTGADRPEQIQQGIDAGIFYYLAKPIAGDLLSSVLASAVRQSKRRKVLNLEFNNHRASSGSLIDGAFECRTLSEVEDLACFLANCFPEAERVFLGLVELMINAVEHGNLEIGYSRKTALINSGKWREEVVHRLDLPEYSERTVEIHFKRDSEALQVKIRDSGRGFNWRHFITMAPSRATDNHGRGIAQSRMDCFDILDYNEKGNEVIATVFLNSENDE